MSKLFISDLHLEESRPDITNIFFKFLKNETKGIENLYILGDLFEAWIGDDNLTPFNMSIIKALNEAQSRGLSISILHGNRDFLLGKKFFKLTGCQYIKDGTIIKGTHSPILLMHGDTLCTADLDYLKFRKKARNIIFQKIFLMKSLEKRQRIANEIRTVSRNYTSTSPEHIMDASQLEIERVMKKNKTQLLIHGHTHREGIHHFTIEDARATRVVLGAWHTHGNALLYNNEKLEFINL